MPALVISLDQANAGKCMETKKPASAGFFIGTFSTAIDA